MRRRVEAKDGEERSVGGVSAESVVCRSETQMSTTLEDEVVALHLKRNSFYNMDLVGSRIWAIIETPARVTAVVESLLEEYEVDGSLCTQEVIEFLERLRSLDLVTVVAPEA
jgi:hypothetical protein